MKRFFYFTLTCCLLIVGLAACSSGNDPMEAGNLRNPGRENDNGKFYTVSLSLGGDCVEESDEPLSRAETSNSYVGINVKRRSDKNSKKEQYAHGVFLSKENIEITLESDFLYSFEATVIEDGYDTYKKNSNGYKEPFLTAEIGKSSGDYSYGGNDVGNFHYNTDGNSDIYASYWLYMLSKGTAFVKFGDGSTVACDYPRVDRYYGTSEDYDPSASSDEEGVSIIMEYKSFGLKVIGDNIPEGTYVTWKDITIKDDEDYKTLQFSENPQISSESGKNSWESVYSLNDLKSSEKTIKLQFTWHKDGDETETFEKETTVKAKYRKTLKITIDDTKTTPIGNISLKCEDSTLTDEEEESVSNKTE